MGSSAGLEVQALSPQLGRSLNLKTDSLNVTKTERCFCMLSLLTEGPQWREVDRG